LPALKPISIVTVRFKQKDENGTPQDPTIIAERNDISWDEVAKNYYNYFIGKGKSSQSACRGCEERIPKKELRIKTYLVKDSYKFQISFHISQECLRKGLKRYNSQQIEHFSGIVWVDNEFRDQLLDIPKFDGNHKLIFGNLEH